MPLLYQEKQGDLFSSPANTSLAHCVSTDMSMSKGIAKIFRDQFKQVDELKKQSRNLHLFIFNLFHSFLYRCTDWWLCLYNFE